jgi:hypothetical protein
VPTKPLLRLLALIVAVLAFAAPASAAGPEAGQLNFARAAESDFDKHTSSPSPSDQAFMRDRFWRMRTYAPYFDSRLSWFRNAWTYKDLYAVYRGESLVQEHADWILRDESGNKLYIPFGCEGGTCPQYAGDFGNPAFRAHWISEIVAQAQGYKGVFVDDVNLEIRVGNGQGDTVMPIDPRTGQKMTESNYRRYIAEFTEQIKAALPGKEIVHNAIWFADDNDSSVRRELDAATHIELERGVNDAGIRGGGGKWGYETFMKRIDRLHGRGKGVIFDSFADSAGEVEYEMASYFLVSSGNDGFGSSWRSAPGDWWKGYDVQLGAPRGNRYEWNGLLRRDFERGYVLVNQPDSPRRSVNLSGASYGPAGDRRTAVSLAAAEGAVIVGSPPAAGTQTLLRVVPNPLRRIAARGARTGTRKVRRARRTALLRGRVKRAAGGRVRVAIQRKRKGRYRTVRRATIAVKAGGRFSRTFKRLKRGRYRVKVRYLGGNGAAAARKPSVRRFKVRR